jgi:hypothetical protein
MPVYFKEDILGVMHRNGSVLCVECMDNEDFSLEYDEEFIFENNLCDRIYICDCCKRRIS